MNNPTLTDLFQEDCRARFGIRPEHAIAAVQNPDQTTTLEQQGLKLRIHSKQITKTKPPSWLVVIEREESSRSEIVYALKAYSDLCDGFDGLFPNDMLEAIAERFGLPFEVGSISTKFLWSTRVAVDDQQQLIKGPPPPQGHSIRPQFMIRIDEGPPKTAEISLGFCLDLDEYTTWLRRHYH